MRIALTVLALVCTTTGVLAQTSKIQRIDVVEYGLYTADEQNCHRDPQGIQRCERTNVRHVSTTLTVPAQRGTQFGVRYKTTGAPDGATVAVKRYWIFPPAGLQSPASKEPLRRLDRDDEVIIGKTEFTSYTFDDPWELVPGKWTLELWLGDRKLLAKTFTVVKP